MSDSGYLFDNAALEAETRFGALASLFDPVTFRHLDSLGVREGWSCLEVGAGGGRSPVGSQRASASREACWPPISTRDGWSDGCGLRTSRCAGTASAPIRFPKLDFDLVHRTTRARARPGTTSSALRSMVASLRPGGWLLVEDSD